MAKKDAGKQSKGSGVRWRLWIGVVAWAIVFISSALGARTVQRFMMNDPRFELSEEETHIEGAVYASRQRILRVFAPDYGISIFHVPLPERRRRLLAIDWIEEATILRVWPNQLEIRIRERKPVAFVNLPVGRSGQYRFALMDEHGVLLPPPPRMRFHFPALNGITEEQSERERRGRVLAMKRMMSDLGPRAPEISEVDVSNVDNLRVVTKADGRTVELWLGNRNFGSRLQNFIDHYPQIRARSTSTSFDLRLDDRITTK